MQNEILGLHHITAIAGSAQMNFDFYTKVLGQRLVKKTVNFDDPGTYHFYYGNEEGTPGTLLTFFPWEEARRGLAGTGMATNFGYAVPKGSLGLWRDRLQQHSVKHCEVGEKFGEQYLPFEDPDGLKIEFVEPQAADEREPWKTGEVEKDVATRGLHNATLTLRKHEATAKVLTEVLGYKLLKQEGDRYRFRTYTAANASIIDILETPTGPAAIGGSGTNHHIAFRVKDEEALMHYREKVLEFGLNITPKIDRDYFFSLYFREPGGVLFEIATDNPGFTRDESLADLGKNLKLPSQYESMRAELEKVLPVLK
ncbi:MAG: ring-cleaving dioxygenase [Chitinophagaceae bacterium]|nr:MAG: ring-cleaving dioxygenase [Chitinophagaceae bacterium]